MSEFIEIQEVATRRGADGNRILKDQTRYCINKDQIVSVSSSGSVVGCVSLLMTMGKPILVRGTVESITGVKPLIPPPEKPKLEVKKAQTKPKKAKVKSVSKSMWG